MCKSSIELGLVYKTFVSKHLRKSVAALKKQTASTVYVTLDSSGSWTRLSFPHNQKHTSLETSFLSDPCSSAAGWRPRIDGRALALAQVDACTSAFFREKYPYKEFHPRLRQQEPRSKKKTLRNMYKPVSKIFGIEILCCTSKKFLKLCPCLVRESNPLMKMLNQKTSKSNKNKQQKVILLLIYSGIILNNLT